MKKVMLLLAFLPAFLYCQIDTTIFPKIGFYDYYSLYKDNNKVIQHIWDSNYYFSRMQELGLTHLVTYGDNGSNNGKPEPLGNTNGLKIIDDNMRWNGFLPNSDFYPFQYAYAVGNGPTINKLPYQVGGDKSADNLASQYWGYGNTETRYMFLEPGTDPNTDINSNFYDDAFNVTVFRALKGSNQLPGTFLTADLRSSQQPYCYVAGTQHLVDYYISLNARIAESGGNPDDTVAEVKIIESRENVPAYLLDCIPGNSLLKSAPFQTTQDTDTSFYITAGSLNNLAYKDTACGPFHKHSDNKSNFKVIILWRNTRTLLVDKFSVYDSCYRNLFVSEQTTQDFWKSAIDNKLSSTFSDKSSLPNYAHLYVDEPQVLSNRAYQFVSDRSVALLNKYVNGAYLSHIKSDFETANFLRRPPYVSMDQYPFSLNPLTGNSTSAVQTALDGLISLRRWNLYQTNSGLKSCIEFAHNFDNDPANDHPYYQIIQVMASKNYSYTNGVLSNIFGYRMPSKEEILVQGNLALCYGAKGIMYYAIQTNNVDPNNELWGLFDDKNENLRFNGDTSNVQPIGDAVVPNDRFYAVKELNASIDKISSELLQLSWVNGYSINLGGTPYGNYISEIKTYFPPNHPPVSTDMGVTYTDNCPNIPGGSGPNNTYVELGEFKKTSDYTNDHLDYFFLVNKLTGSDDNRIIQTLLDKESSPYTNWGIFDVGSKRSWTMNKTGYFRDYFEPGTGKLYRLSPVAHHGGSIDFSETITGTNTLTDSMVIDSGATFTINGTYNANANIIINPGGNLIVAPGGQLNFATGCSLKYSCPHLSLSAIIEGLYNGSKMIPDTVNIELHNAVSPYSLVDSNKGILDSTGYGTFFFTSAVNDTPYYIAVKHRNALETWSASALSFSNDTLSYDFTSDTLQAYGSNMTQIESKWCFYSGDVNQDGYINLSDYNLVNNDAYNHVTGYVVTDLTGNLYINLLDLMIVNNNRYNLVHARSPLFFPATSITKPIGRMNLQLKNDK